MKRFLLGLLVVVAIFSFVGCYGVKGETLTDLQVKQAEQATLALFLNSAANAGSKKPARGFDGEGAIDERISTGAKGSVKIDSDVSGSCGLDYDINLTCGIDSFFSYELKLALNDYVIPNVPLDLEGNGETTLCNVKFKGNYLNNFEIGWHATKFEGRLKYLLTDKNEGLIISIDSKNDGTYATVLPTIYSYVKYSALVNKDGLDSDLVVRYNNGKQDGKSTPFASDDVYEQVKSVAW